MLIQVAIFFWVSAAAALDVSWLPADIDGPLPLSSNYRVALRKLCDLLAENKNIPAELEIKRDVVSSLCSKLESSEKYSGEAPWLNGSPPSYLLYSALVVGGGAAFFMWARRGGFGRRVDGASKSSNAEIREARLKKFD